MVLNRKPGHCRVHVAGNGAVGLPGRRSLSGFHQRFIHCRWAGRERSYLPGRFYPNSLQSNLLAADGIDISETIQLDTGVNYVLVVQ